MSIFDWLKKKNIQDSVKDGLIITAAATKIFFALKAANIKPSEASVDPVSIIKIC